MFLQLVPALSDSVYQILGKKEQYVGGLELPNLMMLESYHLDSETKLSWSNDSG